MHSFVPGSRRFDARCIAAAVASILTIVIIFSGRTALAAVEPFPAEFKVERISVNGVTLHVRVGGKGPAVVLLHGFADTGDMWAPRLEATEALRTEVAHFIDCVEHGKPPTTDGPSGLRVLRLVEAASASMAARGRLVELDAPAIAG